MKCSFPRLARTAAGSLWVLLSLLLATYSGAYGQQRTGGAAPDSLRVDWSDVTRFWQTYDLLATASSRADSLQLVETYYLAPASAGLRAYAEAAHATAADLLAAWRTHKRYLAAIRPATLQIEQQQPAIQQAARGLKKMYPSATFPTIYFAIGKFEVGGTAFDQSLYIGAELKCANAHPPLEEIRPELRAAVSSVESSSTACIHEVIHTQQKLQTSQTNLEGALREGAAEYLAYRLTGRLGAATAFAYGKQHTPQIRQLFAQEADQPIAAKWFLATPDATSHLPGALGYYVGFKICEAYYAQAPDKAAALRQLVALSQPNELLAFGRAYLRR